MAAANRIHRIGWVVVLGGLLLVPYPLARIPAVIFLLCLAPAAALVPRHAAAPGSTALTATTSLIIVGAATLVLLFLGVPPSSAPWIVAALAAVVYMALPARHDPQDRRLLAALAAVVLLAAVLAFALPLTNLWWRVRSDSWFHAAVLNRLSLHGLPLTDPYFASIRLQYMYFYHVLLLVVVKLARCDAFYAMIVLNAIALANLALGFTWLSGFFARRTAPRIAALWMCLFAMNGLFYLFFPIRLARALAGETRGGDIVRHFFALTPPGHDTAVTFLSIENNQFMLLDKFMVGTAISLTFGLLCVTLALVLSAQRGDWSRRHGIVYAVAVLGMLMLHLVVGVTAAAAMTVTLVVGWWLHRREPSARHATLLALTLAAAAIAAPYVYTVTPRGDGSATMRIGVHWRQAVGLLANVLVPLAVVIAYRITHRRPPSPKSSDGAGLVATWLVFVALAALVIDLATTNETKFSFLLFVPLAALAAAGIESMWASPKGRRLAIAYLAVATIPLNAIYFWQAWRDPGSFDLTPDERKLYRWSRTESEPDAVFLDKDDIVRMPVLGERDQYWGTEGYARNWGYAEKEMFERRSLRDAMFGGGVIYPEVLDHLRAMERPFYVICRLDDKPGKSAHVRLERDEDFERSFTTSTIILHRLNAAPNTPNATEN